MRGEKHAIRVGRRTALLDNVRIRSDFGATTIGHNSFIGSSNPRPDLDSSLNSCTIGDHVYIGANASIGKGATVESGAMVAAGAIVPAGAKVPSGQVWAGNPAKFLRDLTAVEKENLREQHHEYSKLAEIHSERTVRSSRHRKADAAIHQRD